ncbi:polygalacturonase PglA [Amaricoccus solimangrovi]|uniref:Glycoside hydrolase family 28 protein n=1 Tax=Amaricoccus solimangrovi TaxID=2589815 RepID=A0A501WLH7_9RHOB|nr:glycoside hydrolase family 28 protein [Amaricoccus solimangrovi]TPE48994.1 glycoside hydrolase family 28 protein [Amaricoccus solimangrovi]
MIRPVLLAATPRAAAIRLPVPGALYHLPEPRDWRLVPDRGPAVAGRAETAVLMLDALSPATAWRLEVAGLAPLDFATPACPGAREPERLVAAAHDDAGAAARNAAAIAAAIGALPPGGTLILPPGDWVAGPVALRSDMILRLSPGATLRAPSRREGWPILPARDASGAMLGSWEGLPAACFAAPVHAIGAERLTIEGPGVLDGSGAKGDWWNWPKETRDGARRPRGLHLIGCRDVTLLGFTIREAPSWTIHPQNCDRLAAYGLRIEAPDDSPNTDGFDPEMCRDVTLEGLRFSVGDDCVAIKAGKRGDEGEDDHLAETRRVAIRHCLMERGHGGVVIGSEMSGGVHEVTVEDCEMVGTDRGLRLKTRRGRGGRVTAVAMRRVRMEGVETALSANAHYFCDHDGHAPWVQSRDPAPVSELTPEIDGISVEEVEIHGLRHAAGCFLGLPEAPIRGIRVSGVRVHSLDPDARPAPPVMADHIRPLRHAMILAESAEITCDRAELIAAETITLHEEEPAK